MTTYGIENSILSISIFESQSYKMLEKLRSAVLLKDVRVEIEVWVKEEESGKKKLRKEGREIRKAI